MKKIPQRHQSTKLKELDILTAVHIGTCGPLCIETVANNHTKERSSPRTLLENLPNI